MEDNRSIGKATCVLSTDGVGYLLQNDDVVLELPEYGIENTIFEYFEMVSVQENTPDKVAAQESTGKSVADKSVQTDEVRIVKSMKEKIQHLPVKMYPCKICGKRYKGKDGVFRHNQSSHQKKRFTCSLCPKTYSRQSSVNRHERNDHVLRT